MIGLIGPILAILEKGLGIWELKLQRKYIEKLNSIKREYYEELKKPIGSRSDAVLDNLEFELRITVAAIASDIEAKNT